MDYTLTGPAAGECSVPALFTLTPVAPIAGSVHVTLFDAGGGTFDTPVVTLTGSAPVQVRLTRPLWRSAAVSATNDGGLIDPPPVTFLSKIQLGASGTAPSGIRMPSLGGATLLNGDLAALKRDARTLPVHPDSAALLAFAGTRKLSILFYPSTANGGNSKYGMPVNVVAGDTGTWDLVVTQYPQFADPPPCRLDPATTCIENYQGTLPPLSFAALGPSDHHALCVVRDEVTGGPAILEEAYQIFWDAATARWSCNSFCRWDLRTGDFRPLGRASVDAAGLPITPLLVRYDEAAAGAIDHAIRITLPGGATRNRSVWPARTAVTAGTALSGIPMGAILRLSDAWYQANRGAFTGPAGSVVDALWKYGAIVADITGSPAWQIVGVQDERWNLSNVLQLQTIPIASFEVCDFGPGWTFEGPSFGRVGATQTFRSRRVPAGDHNYSTNIYLQETFAGVSGYRDNKTLSDASPEAVLTWTPTAAGARTMRAAQTNWTDIEPPAIEFTAYVAGAPVPGAPPPLQLARLLRAIPAVPPLVPRGAPPPLMLARLLAPQAITPLPPDLLSALVAYLRTEPTVAGLLTDADGTVRVWDELAPSGTERPFIVIRGYTETSPGLSLDDRPVDVQVVIESTSLDEARTVGEAVRAAVDTPAINPASLGRPPFEFVGGVESALMRDSLKPRRMPGLGRRGTFVYTEQIPYRFWVQPS